jgi:hypothetical protein
MAALDSAKLDTDADLRFDAEFANHGRKNQ